MTAVCSEFATSSYGDSFHAHREQVFTRVACAELLLDAGAVVMPSVCEGPSSPVPGGCWSCFAVKACFLPAHASIDVFAEFGIERHGSLQQDGRDGQVLEAAGAHERFVDSRQTVPVLIKRSANSVEIAKRRMELERAVLLFLSLYPPITTHWLRMARTTF